MACGETMEESKPSQSPATNSPAAEISNAIALHWSKVTATTDPSGRVLKTRWWQHPPILRHINKKVCGEPVDGFFRGSHSACSFSAWVPASIVKRHFSWLRECNEGDKVAKGGFVQAFDLYELADSRIAAGREMAQKRQLVRNAHFLP